MQLVLEEDFDWAAAGAIARRKDLPVEGFA